MLIILLIVIANFTTTFSKLTSSASYFFWKIHIKLTLALIIYTSTVFTAKDMIYALVLPQGTDINEVARRNFLSFQALAILNSTLLNNLLMQGQPNAESLDLFINPHGDT